MDGFTALWKGHWAPPSKLELHLLLRALLHKEEDQESTGVAGPPASLQGTCAEHPLALLSEDMSTVTLFLELQESRTVQVVRIPRAGGTWVMLHIRVFPTLFSSLVCREGGQGTGTLMQCFKKHSKMTRDKPGVFGYTGHTECQRLEKILDANRFVNGRASKFGQCLGFVVLKAAGVALTQCLNAATGGTEGAFFAQLLAELSAQHSPLQTQ